jgi:uncharacterized YccA/Bax inhibitor family protein
MFNESKMNEAQQSWAAPEAGTVVAPMTDGPVSPWKTATMTVGGTISAAAVLFVLLLVSAAVGWTATGSPEVDPFTGNEVLSFPMLAWVGLGVGFVAVIALYFKPQFAKFIAPVYALAQGFFLGAISRAYESLYDGIVVQAAGATISVFFVMLVLYRTQIIKVTDRFRRIVVGATLGIMVLYGVSFLFMLFGGSVSYLTSPSLLGIGFSVLVCGIAAMNLALDFDFIERGTEQGLSKNYEWYAAFGLLVTIIWLYLEMLRLLAKLRQN